MLFARRIERSPIIPIVKITNACVTKIPPFFYSSVLSTILNQMVEYIETAEKFEGRVMASEEYPKLNYDEELGALIQIVFPNNEKLESFCNTLE